MNPATALIGPLMVPECIRSSRRGWGLIARAMAALLLACPALAALWWWWMSGRMDAAYRPSDIVPATLTILEGLAVTIALVLSPAVLAGSLAGEKERGSIGLLLSTRVDAREIVLGRMFGKLSLVAAMLLAALPFLIGFAVLRDLPAGAIAALIALPMAVGFGIGGLAMAASAIARKGRNALIAVYFVAALLLIAPSLEGAVGLAGGLGRGPSPSPVAKHPAPLTGPLNPYSAIVPLIETAGAAPALGSLLAWTLLGVAGLIVASWRLRPSFLALVGGKAKGRARRHRVPPLDEARPMLWKELHIERSGALGWFGRVLGVLLMLYLVAGTVGLAALAAGSLYRGSDADFDFYRVLMGRFFEDSAFLFSILIQLAVGLRAAVTISSEREQGTWDALLASPLTGREILWGKLWGSLYSLRWFVVATLAAWGTTLAFGGMGWQAFAFYLGQTVVVSAFVAAVGVRASLSCGTATKAMSLTVGIWLATFAALSALAALAMLVVMLACLVSWLLGRAVGLVSLTGRPWVPTHLFDEGWMVLMAASYLTLTALVVMASRSRFDQAAGRLSGDGTERPLPPRAIAQPAEKAPPREVMADTF